MVCTRNSAATPVDNLAPNWMLSIWEPSTFGMPLTHSPPERQYEYVCQTIRHLLNAWQYLQIEYLKSGANYVISHNCIQWNKTLSCRCKPILCTVSAVSGNTHWNSILPNKVLNLSIKPIVQLEQKAHEFIFVNYKTTLFSMKYVYR